MIIIVHSKEERKKCSLSPIRDDPSFTFYSEEDFSIPDNVVLLHPDGNPLGPEDRDKELVLLDATWGYYEKLVRRDDRLKKLGRRSIAGFVTAYPRKGRKRPHPQNHLASIEVIIAAGILLGDPQLLRVMEKYHFGTDFLRKNHISKEFLEMICTSSEQNLLHVP